MSSLGDQGCRLPAAFEVHHLLVRGGCRPPAPLEARHPLSTTTVSSLKPHTPAGSYQLASCFEDLAAKSTPFRFYCQENGTRDGAPVDVVETMSVAPSQIPFSITRAPSIPASFSPASPTHAEAEAGPRSQSPASMSRAEVEALLVPTNLSAGALDISGPTPVGPPPVPDANGTAIPPRTNRKREMSKAIGTTAANDEEALNTGLVSGQQLAKRRKTARNDNTQPRQTNNPPRSLRKRDNTGKAASAAKKPTSTTSQRIPVPQRWVPPNPIPLPPM